MVPRSTCEFVKGFRILERLGVGFFCFLFLLFGPPPHHAETWLLCISSVVLSRRFENVSFLLLLLELFSFTSFGSVAKCGKLWAPERGERWRPRISLPLPSPVIVFFCFLFRRVIFSLFLGKRNEGKSFEVSQFTRSMERVTPSWFRVSLCFYRHYSAYLNL